MEQNDISNITQIIIDLPAMDKYWHTEIADRIPLTIMTSEIMKSKPTLLKFGQQVVYGGQELLTNKKSFFEFKQIMINDNQANVKFVYDIEGIAGEAQLKKEGGIWKVTNSSISENK